MTIVIFIIVLGVLILIHELGHFLFAKKAGARVDEFGFGYPPRALRLGRKWGTDFTLNWIPFGGFVKIFGEDGTPAPSGRGPGGEASFTQLSKKWQAAILAAGVFFNFVFAWFLFSLAFLIGIPAPVDNNYGGEVLDPALTVVNVLPDSPAEEAGLKSGDKILTVSSGGESLEVLLPENFSDFIDASVDRVEIGVDRGGENLEFEITPTVDVENQDKMVGVGIDMVGTLKLPVHQAFYQGAKTTGLITYLTAGALTDLVVDSVKGEGDLSQVTGPVGIVGMVGDASRLGFAYLITFTALISINLALVNLIPFPALDGGRLLLVFIEYIKGSPVNAKFVGILNTIGFFLLISLMAVITWRDVMNLF